MVVGDTESITTKYARQIAGDIDCQGNAAVRCGAHRPMEHIQGFTRSHWMPPSVECLHRISITLLHLEEQLTILDHEVRDDCARPKKSTVLHNVVVNELGVGDNSPVIDPSIDCGMTRPYPSLHLLILGRVTAVAGALYGCLTYPLAASTCSPGSTVAIGV
jgi:hypothetical protein